MHAQDLVVDEGCHGQTVEAISEDLPESDAEPALALIVESIDSVDGSAFMVPSQEEEVIGVLDLVG